MPNWMKIAGVADGVLLAAVTMLGQLVPAWAPDTAIVVQILGVLGSILGTTHLVNAAKSKPQELPSVP